MAPRIRSAYLHSLNKVILKRELLRKTNLSRETGLGEPRRSYFNDSLAASTFEPIKHDFAKENMAAMTPRCLYSVLTYFAFGMPLVAGCASFARNDSPASPPTSRSTASSQLPALASCAELEPKTLAANIPERERAGGQRVTMKSIKPLEWSKTTTPQEGAREASSPTIVPGALAAGGAAQVPALFAERRASEALDRLAGVATIRHEKRGAVITLPSDRLVDSGEWTITSSGQYNLRELAAGLRDQGRSIRIQGYTDSMGTPAVNDALSLRRAEAVRDFLITQGVAAESMRAEGLGAKRPVAHNGTAEGRAQNRRIEIVIAPLE